MNIKLKIVKIQLELLRSILHFLLNFKKPTNKLIIFCSQQLDEVIVVYYKIKCTSNKVALTGNRVLLNETFNPFLKTLTSQYNSTDKSLNSEKNATENQIISVDNNNNNNNMSTGDLILGPIDISI